MENTIHTFLTTFLILSGLIKYLFTLSLSNHLRALLEFVPGSDCALRTGH